MADVRASQGTRQMARSLPIAWLVLLAACAQAPAPAHGPLPVGAIAREPAGVRATLPSTAPAAPVGYRQEVDKLLGELAAKGAQPGGATAVATPGSAGPATLVPTEVMAVEPPAGGPSGVSNEENLATCLDGGFPAFCDRHRLTVEDAARVDAAERHANEIACIDPELQHLCRPELLPDP